MSHPNTRRPSDQNQNIDIILHDPSFTRMFMVLGYLGLFGGLLMTLFNLATPGVGLKPGAVLLMIQSLAILVLSRMGKLKWAAVFISWVGTLVILPSAWATLGLLSVNWHIAPLMVLCGCWFLGRRMGYALALAAASMAVFFYGLHKTGHVFAYVYPPETLLVAILSILLMATLIGVSGSEAFQRKFLQLQESRQKLARSEAQLFALFDSTEDLIWSVETDTFRLIKFNVAFAEYFGQNGIGDIAAGLSPMELLADATRARHWKAHYCRALNEGRYSIEETLMADGRTFLLTFNPIGEQGERQGIAVFARDITEQIQIEAIREREYAFQSKLIESIPGIFYVFGTDGRFLMWNKNLLDQLGVSAHELPRHHALDFVPADQQARVSQTMERVFSEGSGLVEAYILNGQNQAVPYLLTGHRLEWHGEPSLLGIGLDISERKQAEAALQQAKDAAEKALTVKGRFLAHMSHELRTPMNGIIGLSQLAREGCSFDTMQEYLGKIYESAVSLLQIINDILDFSKIEAGSVSLHKTRFSLRELVRDILTLTELKAQNKGVILTCQIAPDLPGELSGDGQRLKQVLINLVDNAIKFTAQGSVTLTLESTPTDGPFCLHCAVRDTGAGISADGLQRLFKPFSQLDDADNRHHGGTGLGLVISSQLVQLMGGSRIEVSSTPGVGSTFSFRLPLEIVEAVEAVEEKTVVQSAPALNALPRLDGLQILVVEDNRVNQMVARGLLQRLGAHPTLLDDGLQAVTLLTERGEVFDAILMDVQMPVMDGYTATRAIREELGFTRIPIIATTAHAMDSDRQHSLDVGMNAHITKPIDARILAETLAELVRSTPAQSPEQSRPDTESPVTLVASSWLDLQAALDKLDGDTDLYHAMIEVFIQENADDAQRIRQHLSQQAYPEAHRIAHTLKGLAGSLGLILLQEAALAFDLAFKQQQLERLPPLLLPLENELQRAIQGLLAMHKPAL